jgi:Leucine-rich repeat (LRR) protein
MGAILDARDGPTRRLVAMKVMLDSADESDAMRFIEEAQVTAQLEHPNIVPVHELGVDEQDQLFYTMKMVRGITLQKVIDLMAEGVEATVKKYPLPALLTIFQKICDALAFAHSRGVIHRDLKPENVMLDDFGVVLVMDWGLAKVMGRPEPYGAVSAHADDEDERQAKPLSGHTPAGTIMGTPQYMAPEQARGEVETLDQRADIYALGSILFQLIYLAPPITGGDTQAVVDKVRRGEIAWRSTRDIAVRKLRHLPNGRVPDSLLAVCRKSLALNPADRYQRVEDLQRDLDAYQSGFATIAEKAGLGKQLLLWVLRHKTASIAAALFLSILPIFTLSVTFQARRAEREAARANAALADLKKTAPTLLGLAESEAALQRFDSALEKLDAALALDRGLRGAYWRRAWILVGQEKFAQAAHAVRVAQENDRGAAQLAASLPLLDELAAAPEASRWTGDRGPRLLRHLESVKASGEVVAISKRLHLNAAEKLKLVSKRIHEWLGGDPAKFVRSDNAGLIEVAINNTGVDTLEPLHGLPIDSLRAIGTNVRSLEPLRGSKLSGLEIYGTKVADLSPLAGMPLQKLNIGGTQVRSLSPVKGAPIEDLNCNGLRLTDFSPFDGAPIKKADISDNEATTLAFLAGAPIEELTANRNMIADLTPLSGRPLRKLVMWGNRVSDLSPLRGAPIEMLEINSNPVKDLSPLLDLPRLERLRIPNVGKAVEALRHHPSLKFIAHESEAYRTVTEFWADHDSRKPAAAK